MFSDKQLALLRLPLGGERVKSRDKNGMKLLFGGV